MTTTAIYPPAPDAFRRELDAWHLARYGGPVHWTSEWLPLAGHDALWLVAAGHLCHGGGRRRGHLGDRRGRRRRYHRGPARRRRALALPGRRGVTAAVRAGPADQRSSASRPPSAMNTAALARSIPRRARW